MTERDVSSIWAMPKWKLALAGLGALYLAGFMVWGVYAVATSETQQGASELAANPERQDEILGRRRAEEARRVLGLSDEQTGRLAALMEKHTQKMRALRSEDTDDFEARREQMVALRTEMMQELDAILTDEQREKLESLPMQERGRIFGRGAFAGASDGMRRGARPEDGRGPRGPRPEGAPAWGDGPRGPRPEGAPAWGDGQRRPRPEGIGTGYGSGFGRGLGGGGDGRGAGQAQ